MTAFLLRLWTFVRPYRTRLFFGLGCGILFALTNGALYLIVKLVVNAVFGGQKSGMDELLKGVPVFLQSSVRALAGHIPLLRGDASQSGLVLVILLIPLVMFFRSLFNYLNVYLVNWASARAIADLRTRTFSHLQDLPLSFFGEANTGDLISRVTSDTQTLRNIIGTSVASLLRDPVTILFLVGLLFAKQPVLTFFAVVVLPACVVPISIYSRKVRKSARAAQTHAAELSKLMHESFTGNRIIKAYNLEETVMDQFRAITRRFVSQSMRTVRANEIPSSIMEVLGSVGIAAVLLYTVWIRTQPGGGADSATTSTGEFIAFIGAIFMMYQPIKALTRLHNQLHQAQASSQRVFELLDTVSSITDPANPKALNAAGADIHFKDLDFDYGEKPVLRDVNLIVKAGHLVALVGSSGSGKTTITNLLLRFYDPRRGSVQIGDTDIRQVAIKDLRRQIALVTQETILFHETIRRNIALGRPDASDAEVEAAARAANAHAFIMQKPRGYDSVVGEKGTNISGGQRQRIAIARAILKNAPVLVLDEATSALDSESEHAVQAELEKLMEGRTTICIAHRLSTVQKADLIVVMSEGRIVETGTHAQLIQRGGVYQKLHELQFQEQPGIVPGPDLLNTAG